MRGMPGPQEDLLHQFFEVIGRMVAAAAGGNPWTGFPQFT
jgi:hypothetical protein